METPFTYAAFKPDAAFAGAAERFLELLRSFGMPGAGAAGAGRDWSSLAAPLAGQFEQWLKTSQSAGPWFAADNALKLYELWVSCAEESYAATVRKDDFCRLQAELANTSAALLVEQRRHAETLVRAFGLPSRNEVDALYAQLKDLRRQLAELAEAARSRGAGAPRPARPAGTGRRKRPRKARA